MKKALTGFVKNHLIIIVAFFALAAAYMHPALDGKVLYQHDMVQFDGMKQELIKFHEETGEYSLWTNSIFSGMPSFHVGPTGAKTTLFRELSSAMRLWMPMRNPIAILFTYLICFYILLLSLKTKPWVAGLGAVAFALSSYNLIILQPGHVSKAYAIAYMAPVVAGMLVAYRGKYLAGGLLFLLGLGLELYSNHLQITYYLFMLAIIMILTKGVFAVIQKQYKRFLLASGVLLIAAFLALLPNLSSFWVNYEISKQSLRGEPVLSHDNNDQTTGLNKSYALGWSYGKAETFSLMIPNMAGGKSGALGNNEKAFEKGLEKISIREPQLKQQVANYLANQNQYWGAKQRQGTAGSNYAGAIVVFFFVLGLLMIRGPMRWWIIISSILSVSLAWGSNLPGLSDFFLEHVPFYNKFRTVEMTLVIICFNIPLLAFLLLDRLLKEPDLFRKNRKKLYIAFGLTGGLSFLFFLFPGIFPLLSSPEREFFYYEVAKMDPRQADLYSQIREGIEAARTYIFRQDALRSFWLILAAFGLTWLLTLKKMKWYWPLAGLAILIIAEMWLVDLRYLNKDNFITKQQDRNIGQLTAVDEDILEDEDIHYRVANLTVSTWQDGTTSFHHKSIGGYHGIKLRRYQDLIDSCLAPSLARINQVIQNQPDAGDLFLARQQALNMINTKHLILRDTLIKNRYAMGNAWVARNYRIVDDPNEEIDLLRKVNLREVTLVNREFESMLGEEFVNPDGSGEVKLTDYMPDHMTYEANLDQKSLVVFSEIHYEGGWQAYIDGEPVEHLRANYLLRALPVPAGNHTIEFVFRFEPFEKGEKISLAGSFIALLVLLGGLAYSLYGTYFRKPEEDTE